MRYTAEFYLVLAVANGFAGLLNVYVLITNTGNFTNVIALLVDIGIGTALYIAYKLNLKERLDRDQEKANRFK